MQLYYATTDALNPGTFHSYLLQLPESERNKALKYRRPQDSYLSVIGKALLMRGLSDTGYHNNLKDNYALTAFGRPYLQNGPNFNISHSGNMAVCVIADNRIGIDIEEVKRIDFDSFADYFIPDEWNFIQRAANPLTAFYTLWCKKEAVIKADGKGLSNSLREVVTLTNQTELDRTIYYTQMHFIHPDYVLATACATVCEEANIIQLHTL